MRSAALTHTKGSRRFVVLIIQGRFDALQDDDSLMHTLVCWLMQNLRQIWDMADADNDANLSLAEFCVAMHLVVCASKKGLAIPATLPRSLAIAGTGSSLPAGADATSGGSSSTPGLQTPKVRSSPKVQSSTAPAGAISAPMAAINPIDCDDAFRQVREYIPKIVANSLNPPLSRHLPHASNNYLVYAMLTNAACCPRKSLSRAPLHRAPIQKLKV